MKISKYSYLISGLCAEPPWSVNSGFITGEKTTLIIDTGSNCLSAQTIFGYALSAKQTNDLMIVNTEPHFDHIGGNSFFADKGIDIYSSPELIRSQNDFFETKKDFNKTISHKIRQNSHEEDIFFHKTKLANPNKELADNQIISLGNIEVQVIFTPGHTRHNISLFSLKDGVLFCGDCVVTGYLPNLECGNLLDWETWIHSIKKLKKLKPEIIVPGHGYHVTGQKNIDAELNRVENILYESIKNKKAPTL